MTYKVKKPFRDKENALHLYNIGDKYPVKGDTPGAQRCKLLVELGFIQPNKTESKTPQKKTKKAEY